MIMNLALKRAPPLQAVLLEKFVTVVLIGHDQDKACFDIPTDVAED
jgi:hypothetical protein